MPKRTAKAKRAPARSSRKSTTLKRKASFSSKRVTLFALVFALIAGFAVWRIFAANSVIQTVEAEQMVLGSGVSIVPDSTASGSSAVVMSAVNSTLGATFYVTSDISSVTVNAHATSCQGSSSLMTVTVDGQKLFNNAVVSHTAWAAYSKSYSSNGKTSHIVRIAHSLQVNAGVTPCDNPLFVDDVLINGPGTSNPSVRTGSNPITVASGTATTIQWGSTNTTGACSAGGSWSGGKNQNGTFPTAALTGPNNGYGSYLYKLTCSGPNGTAFSASTVNVVPGTSGLLGLPSVTTLNIDPADATKALGGGKFAPNLTPTNITTTGANLWARVNPNGSSTNYYFQYHKCKANLPPTGTGGTNTGGCNLTDSTPWIQYPTKPEPVGSGYSGVDIATPYLAGLSPGTAYIYRVVAVNAVGAATDTGYLANPAALTVVGTQSFYTATF